MQLAESFWQALDEVARERKHLLFVEGPEMESTRSFVKTIVDKGWTQFYAVDDSRVVGWCDILPHTFEGTTHVGKVGMGVIASHRGRGLGRRLIKTAIAHAFGRGIIRIELEVFASNIAAVSLYQNIGFREEGRKRKTRCLDGIWDDNIIMSLFTEDWTE